MVKWDIKNISSENNVFTKDSNDITIPEGYYTFSDLSSFLSEHGISIKKTADQKIILQADKDLNLKSFGPFLGFSKDKAIIKDTDYRSENPANFLNSLREIKIFCPFISSDDNYSYDSGFYKNTNLLATIHVDSSKSLNGSYSIFRLDNIIIPCKNFTGQEMTFNVESGGYDNYYTIFLTLAIK